MKENVKRVWCLYRVSTKSQVHNGEDIPMQKNACRTFIAQQEGWVLANELYERGVSGWKSSIEDRDALNIIKEAAVKKEFDILLVFMYDRLGRKEDETPLVIDFLHKQGISVYSVKEGEMKSDDHIDKLLNYITFWQSSGESLKTSIRVKEEMKRLNELGYYLGGMPPYGYDVVETNEKHPKKDKFLKTLKVNEDEAKVVKLIFEMCAYKNYGRVRIAREINERGYLTKKGNKFSDGAIYRILNNPIYIGRKKYGFGGDSDVKYTQAKLQPYKDEWRIISDDLFYQAQELIDRRRRSNSKKEENEKFAHLTRATASKCLLSGIIVCGYCGGLMKTDYSYKDYKRKTDGKTTRMVTYRYRCRNGHVGKVHHDKKQVGAKMIDKKVEDSLISLIKNIDLDEFTKMAKKYKDEKLDTKMRELNSYKNQLNKKYKHLNTLNEEVPKALLGESSFSPDMLNKSIKQIEKDIDDLNKKIAETEKDLSLYEKEVNDFTDLKNELDNWESKFRSADLDAKKTMISRVLRSVVWKKDSLVLNVSISLKQSLEKLSEVSNNKNETIGLDDPVPDGTGHSKHGEETGSKTTVPNGTGTSTHSEELPTLEDILRYRQAFSYDFTVPVT